MAWLSGYSYRKQVNITGQSGAGTGYQVKLSIGDSAGGDFHLEGHCQNFPHDIRFTDDDGSTELDYWIEDTTVDPITVWVEVNDDLGSDQSIYCYYGKSGDSTTSDGDNTFIFFDDFESSEEFLSADKTLISSTGLGTNPHNVMSFIEEALWVYNGNQYVIFVDKDGDVIVGKRSFPSGDWSLHDTGYNVDSGNQHEVASLGIDSDGYIHISWGMHADPLNYARSDNAEDPSTFSTHSMTGQDESSVTYPRFFKVGDTLFFSYRSGVSSDGDQMLNKYDTTTQTWSVLHHPLIDGEGTGTYVDNFAVDDDNKIHISFCFRVSHDPLTNADYSYAYSDDNGSTWKKSDGTVYSMPITRSSAEKFESGNVSGLLNQNHIDVDGNGHPHIVYWKLAGGHVNYFHTWHNGSSWQTIQLTDYDDTPTSLETYIEKQIARPGILINRTNNRVYVFTRHHENDHIEVFKSDSPYTSWTSKKLGNDTWGWQEFGGLDYYEWHNSHNLYLSASPVMGSNPISIYILKSNLEDTETMYSVSDKWEQLQNHIFPDISDGVAIFHKVSSNVGMSTKTKYVTLDRMVEAYMKYDGTDKTAGGLFNLLNGNPYNDSDSENLFAYNSVTKYRHEVKDEGNSSNSYINEEFPTSFEVMGLSLRSGESKAWRNYTVKNTHTSRVPDEDLYVSFREWGTDGCFHVDWVRVRKYADPEPAFSSAGAEEEESTPSGQPFVKRLGGVPFMRGQRFGVKLW